MENNMLQRKDPFLKSLIDTYRYLARRKNRYGNRDSRLTEANEGIAFATTGDKEEKGNDKKEITCFKYKRWATI